MVRLPILFLFLTKVFLAGAQITSLSNVEKNDLINPAWITIAESQYGQKEIAGVEHNLAIISYHSSTSGDFKSDEIPWCSSFVNWVLKEAGIKGTDDALAKSWVNWGTPIQLEEPVYGSIGVFRKIIGGVGRYHVGFVVGRTFEGKIVLLGGNQSNMVRLSAFAQTDFVYFGYPNGFSTSTNMPVIDIKKKSESLTKKE